MNSPLWTNLHVLFLNKHIMGHTCTIEHIEVLINHRIELSENENHGVHSTNKHMVIHTEKY